MSVKDKVVVITGGGSGIGAATARVLAKGGAKVAIAGRRAEALQAVAAEIKAAHGADVLTVQADVTREADWVKLRTAAVEKFGQIDFVFANAGWEGTGGPLAATPAEDILALFNVNVVSLFLAVKHFSDELAKTKGAIAVTSSLSGLATPITLPFDWISPYAVSKSAVDAFVRDLNGPLAARGVRIFGINPAVYESEMVGKLVSLPAANAMGINSVPGFSFAFNPLGTVGDCADVGLVVQALVAGTSKLPAGQSAVILPSVTPLDPMVVAAQYFYNSITESVPLQALYPGMPVRDVNFEPVTAEKQQMLKNALAAHLQAVMAAMAPK